MRRRAVGAGLGSGGPVQVILQLLGELDEASLRGLPVPTKRPSKEPGPPLVIT